MARIYLFLFLLFLFYRSTAQQSVELGAAPEKTAPKLSVKGFSYPIFIDGETHSNFIVAYPFDEKLQAELQGFYDTYRLADVTRFVVRGKYYTGDKFYIFSGMASEFERNKTRGTRPSPPRMFLLNGTGYDFSDRLNLELRHEVQINDTGTGYYGVPKLLSVQGKYKF